MGIKLGWYEAGIMSPVLEQRAALLVKFFQMLMAIAVCAGVQDHVMGALDGIDAVELHISKLVYKVLQLVCVERAGWFLTEPLLLQKQALGLGV